MQNVATGKSELAALPLTFSSDSSVVIEDSSTFRSLLRDASDKEFSQPVVPRVPKIMDESKLSETAAEQTELNSSGENPDVANGQVSKEQTVSEVVNQQIELTDQTETIESAITVTEETIEITEQQGIFEFPVVGSSKHINDNVDFTVELDNVIPAIDLLVLLEQSQFKEVTITQGQNAVIEDQFKDIQGLVDHLETLSEQGNSLADTDTDEQTINLMLSKLITALEEHNLESELPVNLPELLSKIQSDIALENKTELLPAADGDEHVELDIELLSIVIAKDDSPAETSKIVEGFLAETPNIVEGLVAETPNIVEGLVAETPNIVAELLAETQQELVEPLQQTKNIVAEADFSENTIEEAVVRSLAESDLINVVEEIENLEVLQPISEELIEELDVVIQPDETKILSHSVESKDIRQLLALPPEKLEKALENLTNRLEQMDSTTNDSVENQTKFPSSIKQDFIAGLKTSIDEIKSQLKQGKQIDTDLKSLVVDNLNQISQDVNPESISATISRFTQTLELSASLIAHTSANSANGLETPNSNGAVDRVLTKENQSQSNLLQVKQAKQQVVQFEKAVNIMRSEGHQQLVEKVRWMVNQNNLQADIRLDPPDLGAMKVRVSLSGETASVNIAVQSQQAKDLLDSAAPRLRELLEEQGIQLGQSSVEQEQRQKDQNDSAVGRGTSELASETESEEGNQVTEQTIVNGHLSGIDYFV